ncbi:MAG: hypothetical protein ABSC72_13750 [Methylovirgula sp.]
MSARGQLEIAAGFATRAGKRADNQDFGIVDLGYCRDNSPFRIRHFKDIKDTTRR